MSNSAAERPILAVDVDGVISLFGFDDPAEAPGEFKLIDGVAHCISLPAGERLRRLAEVYDLVWATGWEERANEYLPPILGLPDELPYLTFDGRARFGSAHWKIEAIGEYAGGRRWPGSTTASTRAAASGRTCATARRCSCPWSRTAASRKPRPRL